MDAWDKVNDSGESGYVFDGLRSLGDERNLANKDRPKEAVASLIKRLAHRNANVQIYTLEVCFRCPPLVLHPLTAISWQTPSPRTATRRCTESWHRGRLRKPC